jgi:hypothetical protein
MTKKPNLKIGKKYVVVWKDTFSEAGWKDEDSIITSAKEGKDIESVGYYFGLENDFLIFTRDFHKEDDEAWGDPNFIPVGCIKKIKLVR